jgi:hypothetical protein
MRSKWWVSLLASILVAGVVIAVVAVAATRSETRAPVTPSAAVADDQRDKTQTGDRGGPPPWAQAHGKGHGADPAWKEAWAKLTPAQKRERTAVLVRAHRRGMATWADCVAAAGGNRTEKAQCVKPLPPGLAKKNP